MDYEQFLPEEVNCSNESHSRSKMDIRVSETYMKNLYGNSSVYRKVLGLNWDTGVNDFIFDLEIICYTSGEIRCHQS